MCHRWWRLLVYLQRFVLRQLSIESGHDISVCLVEKGSEIGAHILSGQCFEPRGLNELFPPERRRRTTQYACYQRRNSLIV